MSQRPLFLSETDIADLATYAEAIDVLDNAFARRATGNSRITPRVRIPVQQATYNVMAAASLDDGVFGLKVYTVSGHGAPMHILLHAVDGSGLLAVLEAGHLSALRTGAVSGLSARYMSAPGKGPIGVIGSGRQAGAQVHGVVAATGATVVNVFSRDPRNRKAFTRRLAHDLGIEVNAVPNVSAAAENARVLVTITNSPQPVLRAEDVSQGTHVIAAGNNTWLYSEIDPYLVSRCAVVAVDDMEQARIECGELMRAVEMGLLDWNEIVELAHVVSGSRPGRTASDEVTLFESQGVALADVALAAHVYRKALETGRGLSF